MINENVFVPKILLCGDESEFIAQVGNRPFKLVGYLYLSGEFDGQHFDFVNDGKIFFNNRIQDLTALVDNFQNNVDYIVFTNWKLYCTFKINVYKRRIFCSSKILTLKKFKALAMEFTPNTNNNYTNPLREKEASRSYRSEFKFIPNVLLCGDEGEFISRVGNRLFKIVGHVQFLGEINGEKFDFSKDGKFLLEEKLCEGEVLTNMIQDGAFDFLVFNDLNNLRLVRQQLVNFRCPRSQFATIWEFKNLPTDNFYDLLADNQLINLLRNFSIRTLLDMNAHFVKSQLLTKEPNTLTEIDCIYDGAYFPPMKDNIFHHVYKNFSECLYKHYDAVLVFEKTSVDFDNAFYLLKDIADIVITFTKNGSELVKHLQNTMDKFLKVDIHPCISGSGQWIFCYRKTSPQDFAMYVVTHKVLPPELIQTFPDKYQLIHAGRALGEDLGYLGDNTGDNISELNPYLNELTALYWMWKNTKHTVVGISHYRRFLKHDRKNFLTEEEALKILEDYDFITRNLISISFITGEIMLWRDKKVASFALQVIRKKLMATHPDYLEAFDYQLNSPSGYFCNIFLARRNVFEAYCEWLFSFIVDSTREVLTKTSLAQLNGDARRIMGFYGEQMLTVWLRKNNLRIKELPMVTLPLKS